MDDFYQIKKIDSHTHLNAKNDVLVNLAREYNFRLVSINVDVPDYPSLKDQSDNATYLHEQYSQIVDFVTAFSLDSWDSVHWAKKTIEKLKSDFNNGALGVKVWKNIGMERKDAFNQFIMIDNQQFDPVFDFISQQNKTVVGHLGEPLNCWLHLDKMTVKNDKEYFKAHPEYHMYFHPEYPSYQDQIKARDKFLQKHPNLRFVGAHLGSLEWSIDELSSRLDKYPNMAVDLAERICHLQYQSQKDWDKVRQFFIQYQDRILYGTDIGFDPKIDGEKLKCALRQIWLEDWKYFTTDKIMTNKAIDGEFKGLSLPDEVIEKIYYLNAKEWFNLK